MKHNEQARGRRLQQRATVHGPEPGAAGMN